MVDLSPEEFCELMQVRREDLERVMKFEPQEVEAWEREGIIPNLLVVRMSLFIALEEVEKEAKELKERIAGFDPEVWIEGIEGMMDLGILEREGAASSEEIEEFLEGYARELERLRDENEALQGRVKKRMDQLLSEEGDRNPLFAVK